MKGDSFVVVTQRSGNPTTLTIVAISDSTLVISDETKIGTFVSYYSNKN
ncbi:MAG: hypothetical protein JKY53_05185 [Flavobacteriales bacterium]|nr:hypothetical protein [Flavobacteriales bacterium]